jgi:hypothetical protein
MIASVAVQDLLELAGVSLAATIGLSLAAAVRPAATPRSRSPAC